MKFILLILDGWGHRPEKRANAIAAAHTPNFDRLFTRCPRTLLAASGERVGLPDGIVGNSEVGHLNIGAGRVVYQDITRISKAVREGTFFDNPALREAMKLARGARLHLVGLLSDGGVHSHLDHLEALLKMAKDHHVAPVFVHAFTDGRDTPPKTGLDFLRSLIGRMRSLECGRVVSLMGRYWSMDRDRRWDRVERAWAAMVLGEGVKASHSFQALRDSYAKGLTDEFVHPVVICDAHGPVGTMRDGDVVVFFNFRADRVLEITRSLVDREFHGFTRRRTPELKVFTFTCYKADFDCTVCFPPQTMANTLAEVFARQGIRNLRLSETEKYPHVTFYFNGGVERPWPVERRIQIPSPAVATFDLKPEMSAPEITDRLLAEIEANLEDVFVVNFANPDTVGHTGIEEAALRAVETVDACLGRIVRKAGEIGACTLVTADHGNCEQMEDEETHGPFTAHTLNPVPFILAHPEENFTLRDGGALENIAPTLLDLMGIPKPEEMKGTSLLQ